MNIRDINHFLSFTSFFTRFILEKKKKNQIIFFFSDAREGKQPLK